MSKEPLHSEHGNRAPLPLLATASPMFEIFREKIESLGFAFAAPESLVADPGVALFPISAQTKTVEITQACEAFRSRFPSVAILGVYTGRMNFKAAEGLDAGITRYYALPVEEEQLVNKLFELSPTEIEVPHPGYDDLMRVNILEFAAGQTFDFSLYLYLPMNRRIILYLEAGRPVDEKIIKKFKENPHFNLFIRRVDLRRYLRFTRAQLTARGPGEDRGSADGGRVIAGKLAAMMGGFFTDEAMSDDDGKAMLETLKTMIADLEDQSGAKKDLVQAVSRLASRQMSHASHAQNVAAYSCLFGLALGVNEPETLRMGGLLHDLGLSDLPNELIGRDLSEMTPDEAAKYKLHPGGGKYSVETRKLALPPAAVDMILYHHERPDGSGYPYGKTAAQTPLVAKICALADEFDKLTSVRPGKRQLSPAEAMARISGRDGKPPASCYEAAVHGALVDLFAPLEAVKAHAKAAPPRPAAPSAAPATDPAAPAKSGKQTTSIEELLKTPRFAKSRVPQAVDARPATLQAALEDLRSQLNEYWSGKVAP